jgi:hypothetical protein
MRDKGANWSENLVTKRKYLGSGGSCTAVIVGVPCLLWGDVNSPYTPRFGHTYRSRELAACHW